MEGILGALDSVVSAVGSVAGLFTSQPVLTLFLAGSVAGVAFGVFRKAKKSAR